MENRQIPLTKHLPNVSRLAYGCMGLGGDWNASPIEAHHIQQAHNVVDAALENNINFFDHADIYTLGKAEQVFAEVLKQRPELREKIYLQSKCGIRFADEQNVGRYDFSKQWLEQSIDGILQRLNVEYIDVLLLHRPDPLMDIDEVAQTLQKAKASGKVNFFGVSNMNLHQIEYLQSALDLPLVANQLELSLEKHDFVTTGVGAQNPSLQYVAGTTEYCQKHNIQIQSWGSLARGKFSSMSALSSDNQIQANTAQLVFNLAEKYSVSPEAIVLGFLTRHPAMIQPMIGTTNCDRIRACADIKRLELSREDWYALLVSSLGDKLP